MKVPPAMPVERDTPTEGQVQDGDRSALAAIAFVEIVDTLVDDFDVIDVLTVLAARCVELLGASAAGILLADNHSNLRVIAASTEQIQLLELFQIQNEQGPCLDCFRSGTVVAAPGLDGPSQWPQFAAECSRAGFLSVCAVPMRFRSTILGCLNLFMKDSAPLADLDIALAQALADVASIAIVQDQATRDAARREGQLQHALTSRILIEQAKGMISERLTVDMDKAFSFLRAYARNNNRKLTDVAAALVTGKMTMDALDRRPERTQDSS